MAITLAFQAKDTGPIPVTRSAIDLIKLLFNYNRPTVKLLSHFDN